jgi:hypothetical protein
MKKDLMRAWMIRVKMKWKSSSKLWLVKRQRHKNSIKTKTMMGRHKRKKMGIIRIPQKSCKQRKTWRALQSRRGLLSVNESIMLLQTGSKLVRRSFEKFCN